MRYRLVTSNRPEDADYLYFAPKKAGAAAVARISKRDAAIAIGSPSVNDCPSCRKAARQPYAVPGFRNPLADEAEQIVGKRLSAMENAQ